MDHLIILLFFIGSLFVCLINEVHGAERLPESHKDLALHSDGGGGGRARVRRQYYVCPPDFERISSNCYYFSRHMATWQDAHHDCKDRHSELAILQNPAEDKKLRGQLNKSPRPIEWWIGGIYNWEQMKWKWVNGNTLTYHGFSRMGPDNKEKLQWHCIILDPRMKYKWSGRSCVLGKHYICQKKVMRVGKRGLDKLRKKYNNTLNEVPAPLIYEKPRKPTHNRQLYNYNNTAYGHRANHTMHRRKNPNAKNIQRRKNRKHRKNNRHNYGLQSMMRNSTDFSMEHGYNDEYRKTKKRNRRYKSKESKESKENNSIDLISKAQDVNSIEDLTQKTTFMTNTLSPFHPQVIVEEHDFLE